MTKMIFRLSMQNKAIHTAFRLEQATNDPIYEADCLFLPVHLPFPQMEPEPHEDSQCTQEGSSCSGEPSHSTTDQHVSLLLTLALFLSDGCLSSSKQLQFSKINNWEKNPTLAELNCSTLKENIPVSNSVSLDSLDYELGTFRKTHLEEHSLHLLMPQLLDLLPLFFKPYLR